MKKVKQISFDIVIDEDNYNENELIKTMSESAKKLNCEVIGTSAEYDLTDIYREQYHMDL